MSSRNARKKQSLSSNGNSAKSHKTPIMLAYDDPHEDITLVSSAQTPSKGVHSPRRSGRTNHDKPKPGYSSKFHPMDTVLRPKRAQKLAGVSIARNDSPDSVSRFDDDYTCDNADEHNESSSDYDDDARSETVRADDDFSTPVDKISVTEFGRKPPSIDSKATRHSKRAEARKPVLYSARIHPLDSLLPRNRNGGKKNTKPAANKNVHSSSKRSNITPTSSSNKRRAVREARIVDTNESDEEKVSVGSTATSSEPDMATTLLNSSAQAAALSSEATTSDEHELQGFRTFDDIFSASQLVDDGRVDETFVDTVSDAVQQAQDIMRTTDVLSPLLTMQDIEKRRPLHVSRDSMEMEDQLTITSDDLEQYMTAESMNEEYVQADRYEDTVGHEMSFKAIKAENKEYQASFA